MPQGIAQARAQGAPAEEVSSGEQHLLIVAPLFHIMAIEQLVAAVFLGRGSILLSAFNPQEIMEMIHRGEIYGMTGTPTMYWLLLHKTPLGAAMVTSVKRLGFGAAPMAPDLLKELRRVFPNARLRNGYGMTESPVHQRPSGYLYGNAPDIGGQTDAVHGSQNCRSLNQRGPGTE